MMRDGLRQLIANEPDLEVCGEAEDVATALELRHDFAELRSVGS